MQTAGPTDGHTIRQTDMTKLMDAFHNFGKMAKISQQKIEITGKDR